MCTCHFTYLHSLHCLLLSDLDQGCAACVPPCTKEQIAVVLLGCCLSTACRDTRTSPTLLTLCWETLLAVLARRTCCRCASQGGAAPPQRVPTQKCKICPKIARWGEGNALWLPQAQPFSNREVVLLIASLQSTCCQSRERRWKSFTIMTGGQVDLQEAWIWWPLLCPTYTLVPFYLLHV